MDENDKPDFMQHLKNFVTKKGAISACEHGFCIIRILVKNVELM